MSPLYRRYCPRARGEREEEQEGENDAMLHTGGLGAEVLVFAHLRRLTLRTPGVFIQPALLL
ncbi:MAG: hypothetical protein AB7S61_05620 [Methanoregulaceae archaeon]